MKAAVAACAYAALPLEADLGDCVPDRHEVRNCPEWTCSYTVAKALFEAGHHGFAVILLGDVDDNPVPAAQQDASGGAVWSFPSAAGLAQALLGADSSPAKPCRR